MAVHPRSYNVYLSVQRGRGAAAQPVLMRISRLDGSIADVPLYDVPFAAAAIGDAPGEDDERVDIQADDAGRQHLRSLKTASL
jgi:hypothetical protein